MDNRDVWSIKKENREGKMAMDFLFDLSHRGINGNHYSPTTGPFFTRAKNYQVCSTLSYDDAWKGDELFLFQPRNQF